MRLFGTHAPKETIRTKKLRVTVEHPVTGAPVYGCEADIAEITMAIEWLRDREQETPQMPELVKVLMYQLETVKGLEWTRP